MGLVRRLLIWATVDGLVLQAHGPNEHHKALQIDYKGRQIKEITKGDALTRKPAPLEAHGIVGLLSIASSSFLVAITRREQVAQVFGKPIYVITDIAILPLSSQVDASRAIAAALESVNAEETSTSDTDTVVSDTETDDRHSQDHPEPETPADQDSPPKQSSSSTSFARDVIANRGQYGRFAAQWFSKQGWGGSGGPTPSNTSHQGQQGKEPGSTTEQDTAVAVNQADISNELETRELEHEKDAEKLVSSGSITEAIPKILRRTKMLLTSGSYFFSYEFNLTRRLVLMKGKVEAPSRENLDPLYFWNRRMLGPFLDVRQDTWIMPILQGFVGQRTFSVKTPKPESSESACIVRGEQGEGEQSHAVQDAINHAKHALGNTEEQTETYLLTLISRRSVKRSGLRYLRRGLDDEGNCANAVETEQILSAPDWSISRSIRSFVQVRSSIPLYFSQSPYSFKPTPMLHQSSEKNERAMKKHLQDLKRRYGSVQIACLIDKHGPENTIGVPFEKTVHSLQESKQIEDVQFEWFDFHAECRGMKFENVSRLVDKLEDTVKRYGETVITKDGIESQSGIIRTNCMDCLDRSNVSMSAFGQYMLQEDLKKEGFAIDLLNDESTTWFNTLWADNGDAISRLYASTAALKGDFTRTRRRDYRGALNDFSLTLTRYYNNMVNDYFSQAVIDFLLGNTSWRVFEDFESSMMAQDPGISIEQARQAAIDSCAKQVIQGKDEDLVHAWTMTTPAHGNTLRTLPFEEAVVLLTDAALYCCKFDWTTEKLASFEKANLRAVTKIQYGTYITSTFSQRQMDEDSNAGLVITYRPGQGSIIRTMTRSVQNSASTETGDSEDRIDGGTGILSWLTPASPSTTRYMALKIIPADQPSASPSKKPISMAEDVADAIRRAYTSNVEHHEQQGSNLVERTAIISLEEAKKRTGYLESLGHSIKKMVWT